MGEHYTQKQLKPIEVKEPIKSINFFNASKTSLVEHSENLLFLLGSFGYMNINFGLTDKEIIGNRRGREDSLTIKMFLIWLLKRNTTMTSSFIGKFMNMDHTSILYLDKSFHYSFKSLTKAEQEYWLNIEKEIYNAVDIHGALQKNIAPTKKRKMPYKWTPREEEKKWVQKKYGELDYEYEKKQFQDYYISTGDQRADWDACFRTWIRKSAKMGKALSTSGLGSKSTQMAKANTRRLRDYADRYDLESISQPTSLPKPKR